MHDLLKHKNSKLIKLDLNNSMIEDNCNIENQMSRKVLRKKKLLAEFFPNSI